MSDPKNILKHHDLEISVRNGYVGMKDLYKASGKKEFKLSTFYIRCSSIRYAIEALERATRQKIFLLAVEWGQSCLWSTFNYCCGLL